MAIRIVGVDLPQNKRGEIALTYVYGIGRSSSAKILDKAGVDRDVKVKDWTDDQAAKIREIIGAEYKVEGDLRSEVQLNIKRSSKISAIFFVFLFKIKTGGTSDGIAGNGGGGGTKGLRLFLPFYPFTFLLLKALFTFNC